MKPKSLLFRKFKNIVSQVASGASALVGLFFLAWILQVILARGMSALNWNFFTHLPTPPGIENGGLSNAIFGSFMLTIMAGVLGIPIGVCSGVFLAEYSHNRFVDLVRTCFNVLLGLPSIIIGVFVFGLVVSTTKQFSGHAGAMALAILMLPIVARTTEDMLRLIPNTLRESALALGIPRWLMINGIIFRAAKSGMLTGMLLAIARIMGETAPLLFTALNSPYWPKNLSRPVANLPVTIFNYAMSPYSDWQSMAWGASFLITIFVLCMTLLSRAMLAGRSRS